MNVRFVAAPPGDTRPGLDERGQVIVFVKGFVDDSMRFLEEELHRIGLDPGKAAEAGNRIKLGRLSQWVKQLLFWHDIMNNEWPEVIRLEDVAAFLQREFGIEPGSSGSVPRLPWHEVAKVRE